MSPCAHVFALLCIAFATDSTAAQAVFADGFETPCNPLMDSDADRLDECQELAALTLPSDPDTDADGINDGDEVLGTVDGLDLPAMGVDPRRKDILLKYDWFEDALDAGSSDLCPAGGKHSHRPTDACWIS